MPKNSILCNLQINACLEQQENPPKCYSNYWIINNPWFTVTYYILRNLQNRNLLILPENSVLCNASINMLPSTQNTKKIDSNYYVINNQWFEWIIVFCVICRTQICRLCLERHLLVTLLLIINKKRRKKQKKRFQTFLQEFPGNFRLISLNCMIYKTPIHHS